MLLAALIRDRALVEPVGSHASRLFTFNYLLRGGNGQDGLAPQWQPDLYVPSPSQKHPVCCSQTLQGRLAAGLQP